ncbi:non-ribosomal peptide synthetase/type I polyketide synthase [Photobacterium atrarenae]|uniref:Amino acid adenylation domain-containing protein n=1 Tax=Photobacterium atrarenae TaxID=865757 RepID=A0ABY5GKE5_9GAMM|nr:non-ribosomal peptide synthetase/type I polyketide synthase [Photobacterium atrarenae]UTV29795.1 amino acid adenylation domain-containing protein [Photobacterium atrarenae]
MSYNPIAIIGMSCRFPEANDISQFWENIRNGTSVIQDYSQQDFLGERIDPIVWRSPDFVKAGTKVDGVANFDHQFFQYSYHEAELIDPQQRLFLEACVQALEDGNYPYALLPKWQQACVGIFGATRQSSYEKYLPTAYAEQVTTPTTMLQLLGNDKDYLATRVSYKLGLTGPALTVQTACSSSLVAVHYACRSLQNDECDMALAGGVGISFPQGLGYYRQEGSIFADDGCCRPFGEKASGIVTGNGLAVVLLKRLEDAIADNDQIHGVILGSAVGNDGNDKVGFTAPSGLGQQDVIRQALTVADVSADEIGLIEAHGTGTLIGDPVEINALTSVYREETQRNQYCGIGSVKGNLGHLESAAGIASLVKATLSVRDAVLPPTLGATPTNPHLKLQDTPFFIINDTQPWKQPGRRLAAVSSFGIGGTNCHMIIAQPPGHTPGCQQIDDEMHTLLVQSHSNKTLEKGRQLYSETLSRESADSVARTAVLRRTPERYRVVVSGKNREELREALAHAVISKVPEDNHGLWIFSGQGSQVAGMGKRLYSQCAEFRRVADSCCELFTQHGVANIKGEMFASSDTSGLDQTDITQPALFTYQYALAQQLRTWGLKPKAVLGHSIGEFAAAVVAGFLTLEAAVAIVARRGQLMQSQTADGAMAAVNMSPIEFETIGANWPGVSIAAVNHPERITISGDRASVSEFVDVYADKAKMLSVSKAFHSHSMETIKAEFLLSLEENSSPTTDTSIEFISTLTGQPLSVSEMDKEYWWHQLRQPVLFAQALKSAKKFLPEVIVDLGPDGSFARLARHQGLFSDDVQFLGIQKGDKEFASILEIVTRCGIDEPLKEYYNQHSAPWVRIPTKQFEASRVWPDKDELALPSLKRVCWKPQSSLLSNIRQASKTVDGLRILLIGEYQCDVWLKHLSSFDFQTTSMSDLHEEKDLSGFDLVIYLQSPVSDNKQLAASFDVATKEHLQLLHRVHLHASLPLISILPRTLSVNGGSSENNWTYAALTSLYQAACNEEQSKRYLCLDIDSEESIATACGMLNQLPGSGPVLALRGTKFFEPVVEPTRASSLTPMVMTDKDTALIAGYGGLGQLVATWLSGQGIRRFGLLLRRPCSAEQQKEIETLRDRGAEVQVIVADICEPQALKLALNNHNISPTLVYHTAHSGQDFSVFDAEEEAFSETLRVKTHGVMALAEATEACSLKQFCLFGSIVSWLNSPFTSAYAAANRWQEYAAMALQAKGLPAVTVLWGPWDCGLTQKKQIVDQIEASGLSLLNPDIALNVLGMTNAHGLMVFENREPEFSRALEKLVASSSMFARCIEHGIEESANQDFIRTVDSGVLTPSQLADLPVEEQQEKLRAMVSNFVGKLLKIDAPVPEQAFPSLGLDSLLLIELISTLRNQCGFEISVRDAFQYDSVAALSAYLQKQCQKRGDIAFSAAQQSSAVMIELDTENRYAPFPLTDLQQAFWIGRNDSLELGNVACHQYIEIELDNLHPERLELAWNRLIQRHEMMRCIILESGQQQILRQVPHYQVAVSDMRYLPDDESEQQLSALRERMSYQVMDPSQWPLFELRASLLPGGITRIHLDMDLLVFDVQSFRIIYGELNQLLKEPMAELPALELSFRDYVLAESRQRTTTAYIQSQSFWKDKVETMPGAPQLPLRCDAELLAKPTFRTLDHRLSPMHWERFQQQAKARGLTPSAVMLTVFTQVLAQWCKSPAFTLNITYFNRKNVHPQVMSVCGDFTSLMLLPVEFDGNEKFTEAAQRTQQELWDALEHRDYSGIQVMRDMGRVNSAAADQINMPVVFTSMIGMDFDDPSQPDWELMSKQVFQINQTPQVWLDYQATEYGGALVNRWFIVDEIFEARLIEGLFAAYTSQLEKLAREPECWDNLNSDSRDEKDRQLLANVNDWQQPYPGSTLHDCFLKQVELTPEAPAVLTPTSELTYRELAEKSQIAARAIQQHKTINAKNVVVLLPKGDQAVIAALGAMMAGCVYVPVNPDYDNMRLQHVLAEVDPVLILCSESMSGRLVELTNAVCCSLEKLLDRGELISTALPVVSPDDLAYIIFTSGSTGTPKGVLLDHRCPLNTLLAMNHVFAVGSRQRTLSLCALHHDMSVYDIFGMLISGGAVVMPDAKQHFASHWLSLMSMHKATVINSVPALMQLLVEAAENDEQGKEHLSRLSKVMLGGDWIPLTLPDRIKSFAPNCDIYSIGGPTETAVVSSWYHIESVDKEWESIPYGRPLPNQHLELLNAAGQPVPVGVAGEICMGGLAMSQGYLNDSEMTAKKYRVDPYSGHTLYHTGDLAVLDSDGVMTLLGRMDNQVKINGVRIEPGEIESTLEKHPLVNQAVVLTHNDRLHGFVTRSQESVRDTEQSALADSELLRINDMCCQQVDAEWQALELGGQVSCQVIADDFVPQSYEQHYQEMELLSTLVMRYALHQSGLFERKGQSCRLADLVSELNVCDKYLKILQSWLSVLCQDGYFTLEGENIVCLEPLKAEELNGLREKIASDIVEGKPYQQKFWRLYLGCVDRIEELLQGHFNPLDLMFEQGQTDFVESWYEDNPVSQHFNRVAADAVEALVNAKLKGTTFRVLEFGAGIGSAARQVLPRLPADNCQYVYTDLSDYFFAHARGKFADYPFIDFQFYNINEDPSLFGLEDGGFDLIIGANVLHDAHDVNTSSRLLKRLLKPGGVLLLIEGTCNPRFQMVSLGFVEGLSHYEDIRLDTHLPMLSAETWQATLRKVGFPRTTQFPKQGEVAECMRYHLIAAQNTTTVTHFDTAALIDWAGEHLTSQLVPQQILALDKFPLSANGKVDRQRLQQCLTLNTDRKLATDFKESIPPSTETECTLAQIWGEVLNYEVTNIEANFFLCGGDSLLMTRISALIREHFNVTPSLGQLLRMPELRQQAAWIEHQYYCEVEDVEEGFL